MAKLGVDQEVISLCAGKAHGRTAAGRQGGLGAVASMPLDRMIY